MLPPHLLILCVYVEACATMNVWQPEEKIVEALLFHHLSLIYLNWFYEAWNLCLESQKLGG